MRRTHKQLDSVTLETRDQPALPRGSSPSNSSRQSPNPGVSGGSGGGGWGGSPSFTNNGPLAQSPSGYGGGGGGFGLGLGGGGGLQGSPSLNVPRSAPQPTLSFLNAVKLQIVFFLSGLLDSFQVGKVLLTLETDAKSRNGMIKSCLMQLLVIGSWVGWEHGVIGAVRGGGKHSSAGFDRWTFYFEILYLYPLLLASFYLSGLFNLHVAEKKFETDRRGKLRGQKAITMKLLSESYRIILVLTYLLTYHALRRLPTPRFMSLWIPIPLLPVSGGAIELSLGNILAWAYACAVDGYYIFEFSWIRKGWDFDTRVKYLEERWSYFMGFGVLSTTISCLPASPILSIAFFSLIFPFHLSMVPSSRPRPSTPAFPTLQTNSHTLSSALPGDSISLNHFEQGGSVDFGGSGDGPAKMHNSLIPIRWRFLSPAVWLYRGLWIIFSNEGMRGGSSGPKKHAGGARQGMAGTGGGANGFGPYGAAASGDQSGRNMLFDYASQSLNSPGSSPQLRQGAAPPPPRMGGSAPSPVSPPMSGGGPNVIPTMRVQPPSASSSGSGFGADDGMARRRKGD